MPVDSGETRSKAPAACTGARRLIRVVVVTTVLIALLVMGDLRWCGSPGPAPGARWMRALDLTAPALWPAGTHLRHPETMHPAIALDRVFGQEALP